MTNKPVVEESAAVAPYDLVAVRRDFPILHQQVHGKPLAYLDNAATAQKPRAVIDAVRRFYENDNSNVHRGVHALSARATDSYEGARKTIAAFIGAEADKQLVFTRGTTEAINLVANTFVRARITKGDQIIISEMEHHSNIVPWQMLCEQTGAELKVVPITDDGDLDVAAYEDAFTDRTVFVSLVHVSNALGTVNPAKRLVDIAHRHGVPILLDGAQAAPHMPVDVTALDVDFYTVSGHKMYGPTGIGALYGKLEHLEAMPPWQGGGDMIRSVSFDGTVYNDVPFKFEAGTPNIAGAIGFGAACSYLDSIGMDKVADWEHTLMEYAHERLAEVQGLKFIGRAAHQAGALSFTLDTVHPHDIGTLLDMEGVAVRTGHHCAQPIMKRFGIPATARASFGVYNTFEEIDRLAEAAAKVREMFA